MSILAEPPVAVVETYGKEIIAKHGYRPRNEKVLKKYENKFPKIDLVTIDKDFGGWIKAQMDHFADGASFDQIYAK